VSKEIGIKWFKQAQHDLLIAGRNVNIEGYDTAAFLAQQAVEKALKSVFALHGKAIPKTHYIDDLANKLELPPDIIDKILDLTPDYTLSRYPDVSSTIPFEMYDESLAMEKVAKAKIIISYLTDNYWKPNDDTK
jgi:Uncharacterized conserved protein related to C-terminal domain of eukaryotic chaperone, SACSIN